MFLPRFRDITDVTEMLSECEAELKRIVIRI